jgi:hypothetical protein
LPTARIIEVIAGKRRGLVSEHTDEPPTVEVRLHVILEQVSQAEPGQRRVA